jgi:hypothetical protein
VTFNCTHLFSFSLNMTWVDIGYVLIGLLLLYGIYSSARIVAGEYFTFGFWHFTHTAFAYSLLGGFCQFFFLEIYAHFKEHFFSENTVVVKLVSFCVLTFVYVRAIMLQYKKHKHSRQGKLDASHSND